MKYLLTILITIFIVLPLGTFANGTVFGLADKSLGIVQIPYSASGQSRSFELADDDSLHLNYLNPAMWSRLTLTTFSVDAQYRASFAISQYGEDPFRDYANFQGGIVAFPIIRKRLSFGFGLQPVTSMEHAVQDTSRDEGKDFLLIKGGISRALLNLSVNFLGHFGLGLAYEYNFGKVTDRFILEIADFTTNNITFAYEYRFFGHSAAASAYMQFFDNAFTLGALYRTPVLLKAEVVGKSISTVINQGKMVDLTLPAQYNAGVKIRFSDRFSLGGDVIYQDWEKGFTIEDVPNQGFHKKYLRIGGGLEYSASRKRFTDYINQMDWRLGGFYAQQNQTSNGAIINEYGISAGLSLPLQRFRSRIDLSAIVGKRGDLSKTFYEETFFMFGISVVGNELWFINIEE